MYWVENVKDDLYWIGINDHLTRLFEATWPVPRGINYNAYLLKGGQNILFDTVKECFFPDFLAYIRQTLGREAKIDALVLHHLEPDHSGSIRMLREVFPELTIIGNKKTLEYLEHLYGVTENLVSVEDGRTLNLGGAELKFFLTPMVHWPETMMTYLPREKTLLSGDAFGSFGAVNGAVFDSQLDLDGYESEIIRYFSNIVGKYSPMVVKALDKLAQTDIQIIAPLHGPVWRHDPGRVLALYNELSHQMGRTGMVIAYGSMYGNTKKMMEAVHRGAVAAGLEKVIVYDVSETHISYMLSDIWKYRGLVLGAPTYDTRLFTPMDQLVRVLASKKLQNKFTGVFGTYGWSGGGVKAICEFVQDSKLEHIQPVVEACFMPKEGDLEDCFKLGRKLARRILQEAEG